MDSLPQSETSAPQLQAHVMAGTDAFMKTNIVTVQDLKKSEVAGTYTKLSGDQLAQRVEQTAQVVCQSNLPDPGFEAIRQIEQHFATPPKTPEGEKTLLPATGTRPDESEDHLTEPVQSSLPVSHATEQSQPTIAPLDPTEQTSAADASLQNQEDPHFDISQVPRGENSAIRVESIGSTQAAEETATTTIQERQATIVEQPQVPSVLTPQATESQQPQTASVLEVQLIPATPVQETQASTETSARPDIAVASEPIVTKASPAQEPQSLVVTLKLKQDQQAREQPAARFSDEESTGDQKLVVTLKVKSSMAETPSPAPPITPPTKQQTGANKENFSQFYARERNTRRDATKAFRDVPTPKKPATPKAPQRRRSETSAHPSNQGGTLKRKPSQPEPAAKRRRENMASSRTISPCAPQEPVDDQPEDRPEREQAFDEEFVRQVREVLSLAVQDKKPDMGKRQALRILDLLELAHYPTEHEALFLSTEEATEEVSQGRFTKHIIITTGQQTAPLQTVDEFLGEFYDKDSKVWIQDPEVRPTKKAQIARQVSIRQVMERLAAKPTGKPWNLLELATHVDDGLRPAFLNNEDCRLLTKLKIPETESGPEARRRTYAPGYKEVEKWALVAQAGALTEPHQDSHGYSTFITVNAGLVGFGWLSDPSDQERAAWRRSPLTFRGGSWRYIILKPGQTVYFPAGTVHFVFRLPTESNTLAFGGHVLRCSNIVHWVRTLIEERDQKDVTNEDLTETAPGYLARVQKFVNQAKLNGTVDRWGGEEDIEEFLRLKKEFLSKKQK